MRKIPISSLFIEMLLVMLCLVTGIRNPVKLWAGGQKEPAATGSKLERTEVVLKVLVPASTSAIPFLWLAEQDPLPGIDIQAETFINHPKALAELLVGEADLLLTGTTQGWNNYLDNSPLVILNTGIWGLSSLVGKKEHIKSFADLQGKKIALPFPGAPLDFQTRFLVQANGLRQQDVEWLYVPFTQAIPLLLSGQLDVAPLPEPLATEVVLNKGLKRLLDYRQAWAEATAGDGSSPQVSLFSVAKLAQEKKELFRALVDAWQTASEEVQRQPALMGARYAALLAIGPDVLTTAIANTLYFVPSFEEHTLRLKAYFSLVNRFWGTTTKELGEDFFFIN